MTAATHRSSQQHNNNNNNNQCSAAAWSREHNLLSYFGTRLKGLRDRQTHTHTLTRPSLTMTTNPVRMTGVGVCVGV